MNTGKRKGKPVASGLKLNRRHRSRWRRLAALIGSMLLAGGLVYLAVMYFQPVSDSLPEQKSKTPTISEPELATTADSGPTSAEPQDRPVHQPRHLNIPSLGIAGANIVPVGVEPSGEMAAPGTNHDVGWYEGSDTPSTGSGALLLNGHVGLTGESAVFSKLHELSVGDEITVQTGAGEAVSYTVYYVEQLPTDQVDMRKMMRSVNPSRQGLNIITCAGDFVESAATYTDRVLVYAVRDD